MKTNNLIGAYGGRLAPLNPTPTIDRIGNEGIIMVMDRDYSLKSL